MTRKIEKGPRMRSSHSNPSSIKMVFKFSELSVVSPVKLKAMSSLAHPSLSLFFKQVMWRWHQKDERECTIQAKHADCSSTIAKTAAALRPNIPDVRASEAKSTRYSPQQRFYLKLASFLCYDSVERKNEDDGGNPCQSRRAKMLNERRSRFLLTAALRESTALLQHSVSTYLPQEKETKGNFNRSQPDSVEVHHKVHELLGVCWDQIHNLAHGAGPSGGIVYHQRLYSKQKRQKTFRSKLNVLS